MQFFARDDTECPVSSSDSDDIDQLVEFWQSPLVKQVFMARPDGLFSDREEALLSEFQEELKALGGAAGQRFSASDARELLLTEDGLCLRFVYVSERLIGRERVLEYFSEAKVIVAFADLAEYDAFAPSPPRENLLLRRLDTLADVCNSACFGHMAVILVLGGQGAARAKLERTSFATCFPDFRGADTVADALQCVRTHFDRALRGRCDRPLYVQTLEAFEGDVAASLFHITRDIILKINFLNAGLL